MSTHNDLLTIDGANGEGGGQILRTSLSLALLTGRPVRFTNIRARRDPPGLRPQHLKAVEAAVTLCRGLAEGAAVGSRELTFHPAPCTPRDLTLSIGTAGSTALILHTLALPIALKANEPIRLTIHGGTFNESAPSFPFLDQTWRPLMATLGIPITLKSHNAGFYPRGGGHLEALIEPATLRARHFPHRGELTRIHGISGVAGLPIAIADRMARRARDRLADHGLAPLTEIQTVEWNAPSPGAALVLTTDHQGTPATFTGLGKRGRPAEAVADEAIDALLAYLTTDGLIDPHSADQILLPLALAPGPSTYTVSQVTDHLRTNIATIQAFLNRQIDLLEPPKAPARIHIGPHQPHAND